MGIGGITHYFFSGTGESAEYNRLKGLVEESEVHFLPATDIHLITPLLPNAFFPMLVFFLNSSKIYCCWDNSSPITLPIYYKCFLREVSSFLLSFFFCLLVTFLTSLSVVSNDFVWTHSNF